MTEETLIVKGFPHGKVSDDGAVVTMDMALQDGKQLILEMPYQQLDDLMRSLLKLASGAYLRQVESGRLQATRIADDRSLELEDVRVMPNPQRKRMLVQMLGRVEFAPLSMISFIVNEDLARNLAARLSASAEHLSQSVNPS